MSNTNASRKQYAITYMGSDMAGFGTVMSAGLPEGLVKFIDSISGNDLRARLPPGEQVQRAKVYPSAQYALITRRAAARRIVQLLREKKHHWHDQYKLIEVGEFSRTVRPVSHWNVMRQYRNVDARGKAITKWTQPTEWDTGNATREEARSIAATRYEEHQKPGVLMSTERVKFTVVPVYADEVNA